MDDDRRCATDRLGHLVLGLVAGGFAVRVLTHGSGAGLFTDFVADALPWVAGLVWAARAAAEGRLRVWATGLETPLLLYAIVAAASPVVASNVLPAFARASSILSSILLFLLLVNLPDRRRTVSVVLALLSGAALVNVVAGFHQRLWLYPDLRRLYPPGVPIESVDPEVEQEFRWRMETDEAMGTFFLSNTMAGFLALLLPAALGLAVAAWRRGGLREAVAWTGMTILLVAGLWSTGSTGGWVAAGAACAAYGLLLVWSRRPSARGFLLGSAFLVLLAAGLWGIAGGLSAARLRALHPSIAFRMDYWSAALRIVDEAPLLGVGLDGFGDAYTRYKAPAAQETTRVHNAFLEAWVETGLVGFVVFMSIWGVFLLKAFRMSGRAPPADAPAAAGPSVGWIVGFGFVVGGVVALVLSGSAWGDASSIVLAVAVCLGGGLAGWLGGRTWSAADVAPALAAGVIAFLVHAAIDIDWAVPAMTQSVLLLLAAWACAVEADPGPPAIEVSLIRPLGRMAALLPLAVAVLVFVGFLVPRARQAEWLREKAQAEFELARKASAAWRGASEETARAEAAAKVRRHYHVAADLLAEAQAANPWDAGLFDLLARCAFAVYPSFEQSGGMEAEVEFERARKAVSDAIRLAPRSAGLRAQRGALWEMRADFLAARRERETDAARRERLDRQWQSAAESALASFEEAVDRYPTRAWYRFLRGRVLDRLGRIPEARADLVRALELHALQDIDRLRLPAEVEAGIRKRLKDLESEPSK